MIVKVPTESLPEFHAMLDILTSYGVKHADDELLEMLDNMEIIEEKE